jgi:hypothetical protein
LVDLVNFRAGKLATAIASLQKIDARSQGRLQQLDAETKDEVNW